MLAATNWYKVKNQYDIYINQLDNDQIRDDIVAVTTAILKLE